MANIGGLAEDLRDRFEVPVGFRDVKCRERFSSGVPEIDALLEGGFPRATLSEIAIIESNGLGGLRTLSHFRYRRVRSVDRRQWEFRSGICV